MNYGPQKKKRVSQQQMSGVSALDATGVQKWIQENGFGDLSEKLEGLTGDHLLGLHEHQLERSGGLLGVALFNHLAKTSQLSGSPMSPQITDTALFRLNVGGTTFTTSRSTLLRIPDTFFGGMLRFHSGSPDDVPFIDRDPTVCTQNNKKKT